MRPVVQAGDLLIRYVIWLAVFALGLWAIQLIRGDLFAVLIYLRISGYAIPAIINFSIVIIFIVWLGAVVWLENYLTEPPAMMVFWQRLRQVLVRLGLVLVIAYVINLFI